MTHYFDWGAEDTAITRTGGPATAVMTSAASLSTDTVHGGAKALKMQPVTGSDVPCGEHLLGLMWENDGREVINYNGATQRWNLQTPAPRTGAGATETADVASESFSWTLDGSANWKMLGISVTPA